MPPVLPAKLSPLESQTALPLPWAVALAGARTARQAHWPSAGAEFLTRSNLSHQPAASATMWSRWLGLFNIVCGLIQMLDVALDINVALQYGNRANTRLVYYCSVTLLVFAWFTYTLIFISHYGAAFSQRRATIYFLCLLPVSPLIPTFMWIQSHRIEWVDAIFEALGLDPACRDSKCPRLDKFLAKQMSAPASTFTVPPFMRDADASAHTHTDITAPELVDELTPFHLRKTDLNSLSGASGLALPSRAITSSSSSAPVSASDVIVDATESKRIPIAPPDDQVLKFLRETSDRHFSLMVECVAESVPQGLLQVLAFVYYQAFEPGQEWLPLLSVGTSFFCIVSKCVFISFSIHSLTAVFNFACIASDLFGMFAIAAFLFTFNENDYTTVWPTGITHDALSVAMIYIAMLLTLVLVAILLMVGLAWFLRAVEKLSLWESLQMLCDVSFATVFIHAVVGIIAIVPLICFLESCKFSLIPLLMFSPLSALHFQNSRFFYALFAWIDVDHANAAQFCARVQSTATVFATRFRSLATVTARQRHEAVTKVRIRELFVDMQRHLAAHPPPPAVAQQPPLSVVHLRRAHGSVFAPSAAGTGAGADGAVAVPRTPEGATFLEQVIRLEAAPSAAEMKARLDARELRLLDEASRVLHLDAANQAATAAASNSRTASAPAVLTEESAADAFSWAALLDAHRMTASHMWSSYRAFVRIYTG